MFSASRKQSIRPRSDSLLALLRVLVVTSTVLLFPTISLTQSNNTVSFGAPTLYDSGGAMAFSIAVGDLNGDGKPDLVVANGCTHSQDCRQFSSTIGVLLGNGDGTFRAAQTYPYAGELALADVNGDGKLDIVTGFGCNPQSYTCDVGGAISVSLGNGDGTFQPAVYYPWPQFGAGSIKVADVNGDGKPDIIVAGGETYLGPAGAAVGVFLNQGDGTFGSPATYLTGSYGASSLAVADLNGDGNLDIVVTSTCPTYSDCGPNIYVLAGNGDGTFRNLSSYSSGGFIAESVAIGDVNGDGTPDIVVSNTGGGGTSASIGVLLGNGDGTFQSAATYAPGGFGPGAVTIADLNGDGHPDLVVFNECVTSACTNPYAQNSGGVGILLGNGDGTFQSALTYSSGVNFSYPGAAAAADLNGDGKPDIAIAQGCTYSSDCVGVLLNTTSAAVSNWKHTWGGTANDSIASTARDSNGNVYLAGSTSSFGAGGQDALVLKYDPSGNLLWAKTWGGSSDDYGNAVAVGPDGNVYVTGGTQSFGAGWSDLFLLKFDPSGNLLWSETWGGSSYDMGHDISFDSSGNVLVAAECYSYNPPGTGYSSAEILKFSPDGTLLWNRAWEAQIPIVRGPTYDGGYSLTVDGNGNIFLSGITWDYNVSPNHDSIFVVKFDSSGNFLWNRNWAGTSEDEAWGTKTVRADSAGNVYIAGRTASQCNSTNFSTCDFDVLVLKLDPNGNFVWSKTWKASKGFDTSNSFGFDPSGNLVIAGTKDQSGATAAPILLRIDPNGNLLSSLAWSGGPAAVGSAVTVDPSGNVFVGGGAPNNVGSWQSFTGTFGTENGTLTDQPSNVGIAPFSPVSQTGTITSPTGVIDNGGGGQDAFVSALPPNYTPPSTGKPVASISPSALNFQNQTVNVTSSALRVTVANTGSEALNITASPSITGINAGDFALASGITCANGASIAPGNSCVIEATFSPSTATSESATLSIYDNASDSPQTVSLMGVGTSAVSAAPALTICSGTTAPPTCAPVPAGGVNFYLQVVQGPLFFAGDAMPDSQTLTLVNTGSATLNLGSLSIDRNSVFQTTSCSAGSLAPNASCSIVVTFTPAVSGLNTGTLTIPNNSPQGPQTVNLLGVGMRGFHQFDFSNDPTDVPDYFDNTQKTSFYGCALVSLSDLMATVAPSVTPALMDDWLKVGVKSDTGSTLLGYEPGGYLDPPNVPLILQGNGLNVAPDAGTQWTAPDASSPASSIPSKVLQYLQAHIGDLVILHVWGIHSDTCGDPEGDHYIAALGPAADSNDWRIFDPDYMTASPSAARSSLLSHTEGFSYNPCGSGSIPIHFQILSAEAYAPPSGASFSAAGYSPIDLLVIDPQGRRLGYLSGGSIAEIPLGTYVREYSLAPDGGGGAVIGDPIGQPFAFVPAPLDGTYKVTVSGNGFGPYALQLNAVTSDGAIQSRTATGAAAAGSSVVFQVDYSSKPGSPFTVTQEPSGPQIGLSSTSVLFSSLPIGTASDVQSVAIANTGTARLTISSTVISGPASGDYAISSSTCPSAGGTLAAGAICTLDLVFTPSYAGPRGASLLITDDAPSGSQTISLSGTGVTSSVRFGGSVLQPLTNDGTGHFVATVTVTNQGNITVDSAQVVAASTKLGTASAVSVSGPITRLAPGASATVTLTFPITSALSAATSAPLRITGTYSAGALAGNWALTFRSVTLSTSIVGEN